MVRFKTFHKLLGLVTYLDWIMIFITTLTTISQMFETPEYRVMDNEILQIMDYVFVIAMGLELILKVIAVLVKDWKDRINNPGNTSGVGGGNVLYAAGPLQGRQWHHRPRHLHRQSGVALLDAQTHQSQFSCSSVHPTEVFQAPANIQFGECTNSRTPF